MNQGNIILVESRIIVPTPRIKLAHVVEHSPFAKKLHSDDMAREVRQAVNRWLYQNP